MLQVCVRVRYLAPNSYNILRTARLAPTAWPPSTPIRLANLPSLCALSIPETKQRVLHEQICSFHKLFTYVRYSWNDDAIVIIER